MDGVMKQKQKLMALVRQARKQKDQAALNQAIQLDETLNLLNDKEQGIFYWGVLNKWLGLGMNDNFMYDLDRFDFSFEYSSEGSARKGEIVKENPKKVLERVEIDLLFTHYDIIPQEIGERSEFEDMSAELRDIESACEEEVYTFLTDICNYAEEYGWMECSITTQPDAESFPYPHGTGNVETVATLRLVEKVK